jgi:hypothetical protein
METQNNHNCGETQYRQGYSPLYITINEEFVRRELPAFFLLMDGLYDRIESMIGRADIDSLTPDQIRTINKRKNAMEQDYDTMERVYHSFKHLADVYLDNISQKTEYIEGLKQEVEHWKRQANYWERLWERRLSMCRRYYRENQILLTGRDPYASVKAQTNEHAVTVSQ